MAYIDQHKDRYEVEPICEVLPIAPSTYYEHKAREREPERRPARAIRDDVLKPEIKRVGWSGRGMHKVPWLERGQRAAHLERQRTNENTAYRLRKRMRPCDENARVIPDPEHSDDEDRFVLLGLVSGYACLW